MSKSEGEGRGGRDVLLQRRVRERRGEGGKGGERGGGGGRRGGGGEGEGGEERGGRTGVLLY